MSNFSTTAANTRHFPRRGERFIDGEWVTPDFNSDEIYISIERCRVAYEDEKVTSKHHAAMDATYFKASKSVTTAFDTRNFYRKQAGWPPLKLKENTNA